MRMLFFALVVLTVATMTQGKSIRSKRDVTCAVGGDKVCNVSCKGRGYKDGSCAWEMETGEFRCQCSAERRGIRCNLGGETVCNLGCKATGHTGGVCIDGDKCQCSEEMSAWGDIIRDVKSRL